jgi:hypothetical protein
MLFQSVLGFIACLVGYVQLSTACFRYFGSKVSWTGYKLVCRPTDLTKHIGRQALFGYDGKQQEKNHMLIGPILFWCCGFDSCAIQASHNIEALLCMQEVHRH